MLVCGQKLFVRLNGITEEEELTQRFLDFYRGLWLYFNQKLRPNGEEN